VKWHSTFRGARGALAAAVMAATAITVITIQGAKPAGAAPGVPTGFADTVVLSGLAEPTALAFAPDGTAFVAEKSGLIRRYVSGAGSTVADLRTRTHNFWDRGLLGLAVDPQYPTRPYLYALYTYDAQPGGTAPRWGAPNQTSDGCPTPPGPTTDGCVVQGRLSRLTLPPGGSVTEERVLVEGWCQQFPSHSVGTVLVGPDGSLYAGAGDGASFSFADYGQQKNLCADPPAALGTNLSPPTAEGGSLRAQSLRRPAGEPVVLNGSIVRVDPDTGAGRPGNPFAASTDANARRIVAYGLRNPFRFTARPGTDELWAADVGWNAVEEIDRIPHGADGTAENFGWPCYEGSGRVPAFDSAGLALCQSLYAAGGTTGPYYSYPHSASVVPGDGCAAGSSSLSGVAFAGSGYPAAYAGALFFSDYSRDCVWVMKRGANGQPDPAQVAPFVTAAGGVVQLVTGPDGELYYVTLAGQVHRVRYLGGNQQPTARASASPQSGQPPLTVHFDGSASSDPDGDPLSYSWDLNGDGLFGDATTASPQWTYTSPAQISVRLLVSDGHGGSDTSQIPVTVGDVAAPPVPVIDSPTAALQWKVGDPIAFSGHATSGTGAALPASALSWQVVMYHCPSNCHAHPIQSYPGVASGQFAAPDHEYPSYLELVLSATGEDGQKASTTVRIDPLPATLTATTNPPGLQLTVLSGSGAAPQTRTVIVGSASSLSAPLTQSLNGRTYDFAGWSDGGAATHNVVAGTVPATLVASYRARPLGLVAAYGFEEGSGPATADLTGNGNIGVLTGTAWSAAGRAGKAVSLDGTASLVTVRDAPGLSLAPGMTVEAWVRPSTRTGDRVVLSRQRAGAEAYALYVARSGGAPGGTAVLDGAGQSVPGSVVLPLDTWSHLALTYDGSTLRLYVNAGLIGSTPATGQLPTSGGNLEIGGSTLSGARFGGLLDEVRVYDRALSPAEIAADRDTPVVPAYPASTPGLPGVTSVGANGAALLAVNTAAVIKVRTVNAPTAPVTVGPLETVGHGIQSAPALVSDPATGRVTVFGRGAGNVLYYQWRAAAGPWSGWLRVPGAASSTAPAATLNGAAIDIFYAGTDQVLRHQRLTGSTWSAVETLSGKTTLTPCAYPLGNGQVRLWVVGTDSHVYGRSGSTGHWSGWLNAGGMVRGLSATTGFSAGREDLAAIGTAGKLYLGTYTGNLATFSGWRLVDAVPTAGQTVAATTPGPGRLLLMVGDTHTLPVP
jgi:glucose/arabinose dehydrogenase/PKD repeat protein